MSGSPSTPVAALRGQFGDRKPPDITRKITACTACRKQKIKCNIGESGPPCTRCRKRGLPCAVNKSLQMLLESDSVWKEAMERKINGLAGGLSKIADHLSLAGVMEQELDQSDRAIDTPKVLQADEVSPQAENHAPHNFEIVMDPDAGPAAIPGSVLSPVAVPVIEQNRTEQDLITRGVISLDEAQSYLDVYQNRLDHFLYRIIGDRRSLSQVRAASPLLLSAICAVGSLHLASTAFEKCYQEFVSIAAAQTFSHRNTVDEIRGLCVGAFWLSGISWTCIGSAVRISTEIQLHRSIFKALQGDRKHYLRTRLYYLVYVCDHQFSVPYGRPPMTREDDAIRAASEFLETEHAVEDDTRLVSQVHFWSVCSDIYTTFGVDVDRPLDLRMIAPLRRCGIRLDNLRADWSERFSHNTYVGNYPNKGVGLHYHFANLYLHSMAFRGIGRPGFKAQEVALDIDEIANAAVASARAILRAVVTDTEIQSYLNGLPTYFDVMIAFAVVFLLRVATKHSLSVRVDTSEVQALVADLVKVLNDVTTSMHPRHLLVSVAKGAKLLLEKSYPLEGGAVPSNTRVTLSEPNFEEGLYDTSSAWNGNSFDNFFMGEFDFLSNQDVFNNFQPDLQYQSLPQM